MIVVYSNAVYRKTTVVIVFDATGSALGTMMHSGQFKNLALLAIPEFPVIFVHIIDNILRIKVVIE